MQLKQNTSQNMRIQGENFMSMAYSYILQTYFNQQPRLTT